MSRPIDETKEFSSTCRDLLDKFAASFPNEAFHSAALRSLDNLLAQGIRCDGEPGGWAGGLVYMIAKHDIYVRHPLFNNRDLEAVFGVSMSINRKRGARLWSAILPSEAEVVSQK